MNLTLERKNAFISLVNKYRDKYEFSKNIPENWYEPGMMQNLDQFYGEYIEEEKKAIIRTNVMGLKYNNRTVNLEDISTEEKVNIIREENNQYNSNNFAVISLEGKDLGNLPSELCDVMAPLYDAGYLIIKKAKACYIEQIFQRSRYAEQGVLFVELIIELVGI